MSDRYFPNCLKEFFQENFLGNSENKEDFNCYLFVKFIDYQKSIDLLVTKGNFISTNVNPE